MTLTMGYKRYEETCAKTIVKRKRSKTRTEVGISQALQMLPLFDQPYLRMQTMNLNIVDGFLTYPEKSLLAEYMELERTPVPAAMFVSALSQLWIFGLCELLRTWRQPSGHVLRWVPDHEVAFQIEATAR